MMSSTINGRRKMTYDEMFDIIEMLRDYYPSYFLEITEILEEEE